MAIRSLEAPIASSVWAHAAEVTQHVSAGSVVVILECMKMEIPVEAPCAGEITWLLEKGTEVKEGDVVAKLDDALVSVPAPSPP